MSVATLIFEIVLDLPTDSKKIGDLFWFDQPPASNSPLMAFRYDREWVRTGFAIGGDLPLTEAVQYPTAVDAHAHSGSFGFVNDHMPGIWLSRLVECAHLKGFKSISAALTPSTGHLWALCRTHPQRFSALGIGSSNRPSFQWPDLGALLGSQRLARDAAFYIECASDSRGPSKAADAEAVFTLCAAMPGDPPVLAAPTIPSGPMEIIYGFADGNAAGDPPVRAAVMRELALRCSLNVLQGHPFGQRLYAETRYDRTVDGHPLLVLSATTLAQPSPLPASFARPAFSYLDVADIINREGFSPTDNLEQLFKRVLFLRLLGIRESAEAVRFVRRDNGWSLAPLSAAALSIACEGNEPRSPIKVTPNAGDDVEALLGSARYYGISVSRAKALRLEFMRELGGWKSIAQSLGANLMEISRMQPVFAKL